MKINLCEKRKTIVAQPGHLLVTGGPGCGKTTIALLKAQERCKSLKPGQEILFLSFSRAAVRQVLTRCRSILTAQEQRAIRVHTYHAFCMEALQAHGRLLAGKPSRILFPSDERVRSSANDQWDDERLRLANEESTFCFDFFAYGVASLLERSKAVRDLYGDKYPLIIVDEFQDTDDDQWRLVRALAGVTDLFCLADPDQRIFEYRANIDPKRIQLLKETVTLSEFDLGGENHRSPTAGILGYADAILHNRSPLPQTADVTAANYQPAQLLPAFHARVVWLFRALRQRGIQHPSISIMCRGNSLIAKLSAGLSESHTFNNVTYPPIDHDVVWDAELSAASAVFIASILEWSAFTEQIAIAASLSCLIRYFRIKNSLHPSNTATQTVAKYEKALKECSDGKNPRLNSVKAMHTWHRENNPCTGHPATDWKDVQQRLSTISDLSDVLRDSKMVRLFRARDVVASALSNLWLATGSYKSCASTVKSLLDREKVVAAEREPRGCGLMTIHKSKGKEFDAVLLVEGLHESPFLDTNREQAPFEKSRRLLRVGMTRARHVAVLLRPYGAKPLVG